MAATNRSKWVEFRNQYVPNKLQRLLKEEAAMQLEFDAAKSIDAKAKAMATLLAIRKLISAWIAWPTAGRVDPRVRPPALLAPPPQLAPGPRRDLNQVALPTLKRAKRALPPALIDIEPAPPLPAHVPSPPPPPPPIHPPGVL